MNTWGFDLWTPWWRADIIDHHLIIVICLGWPDRAFSYVVPFLYFCCFFVVSSLFHDCSFVVLWLFLRCSFTVFSFFIAPRCDDLNLMMANNFLKTAPTLPSSLSNHPSPSSPPSSFLLSESLITQPDVRRGERSEGQVISFICSLASLFLMNTWGGAMLVMHLLYRHDRYSLSVSIRNQSNWHMATEKIERAKEHKSELHTKYFLKHSW